MTSTAIHFEIADVDFPKKNFETIKIKCINSRDFNSPTIIEKDCIPKNKLYECTCANLESGTIHFIEMIVCQTNWISTVNRIGELCTSILNFLSLIYFVKESKKNNKNIRTV